MCRPDDLTYRWGLLLDLYAFGFGVNLVDEFDVDWEQFASGSQAASHSNNGYREDTSFQMEFVTYELYPVAGA